MEEQNLEREDGGKETYQQATAVSRTEIMRAGQVVGE